MQSEANLQVDSRESALLLLYRNRFLGNSSSLRKVRTLVNFASNRRARISEKWYQRVTFLQAAVHHVAPTHTSKLEPAADGGRTRGSCDDTQGGSAARTQSAF